VQPEVAKKQIQVGGKMGGWAVYSSQKEDGKMSFSENLQMIRKKNQLSQEELAELLGVSRQAVSKWELGEGYPEVEKLLILSKKLNVSLDSLMTGSLPGSEDQKSNKQGIIRIISPNEGVIIDTTKVMRSQEFKGLKNSPKYALFASDGKEMSYWGAQSTLLGWYRNLEDVNREIEEIQKSLDAGAGSYALQYSVKCRQNMFRTIEE
jgi:transcriptional regulator with XRE-family HTH domain